MRWNAQRAAAPVSWIVLCSIGVNTGKSPTLGNISPDADLVDGSAIRGRFARFEVASCILGQFCEGAWSRVGGGGSAGAKATLFPALAAGGGAGEGVVGLFRSGIFRVSNCACKRATRRFIFALLSMVAGAVASRKGSIMLEKSNLSLIKCPFKTISSNFKSSLSSSRLAGDAASASDCLT